MSLAKVGRAIIEGAGVISIDRSGVTVRLPENLVREAVDTYLYGEVRGQAIIERRPDGVIVNGQREYMALSALGYDTEGITRIVAG